MAITTAASQQVGADGTMEDYSYEAEVARASPIIMSHPPVLLPNAVDDSQLFWRPSLQQQQADDMSFK
jgi:hypothetical protein